MSALADDPHGLFGEQPADVVAALRRIDLFRGLTDGEAARLSAIAELVQLPQDRVVPRGGDGDARAYYFLARGQVAFAEFALGAAPKGPVNPKKRVQPLMQLALRHLAIFEPGDFFANDHAAEARGPDGKKRELALFTCVSVTLLKIPRDGLDRVLDALPDLRARIDAHAEAAYYRQTFLEIDARADVLDFYVKQGLEYARAIKVIQSDKCIDCDACVQACEDRHGVSRIERFGPKLGLVQLTQNCRTCYDARCIEPCNFDAIDLDRVRGEVVVYDNCVGCTLCAKACPHEAIRMVDVIEPEVDEGVDLVGMVKAKQGGDRPGTVVAAGEEKKSKKKKPKRIANKCDHCLGHADMACISACPTGAIIQIDPRVLFRQDGGLVDRADRYFDPGPFERGAARTIDRGGDLFLGAAFVATGIGVALSTWEFAARRFAPSRSLWRALVAAVEGPEAAARLNLAYTAVSGLGRWLGYAGAIMMTVAALYTLRLHVPGLRRLGSSRRWFELHVVFGLAGPALSLLHTNLHVFSLYWVSVLWWSVFLVLLSGLVGRYVYTWVPKLQADVERRQRALDDGLAAAADQWASMTTTANVLQHFLKAQEKVAGAAPSGGLGTLVRRVWSSAATARRGRREIEARLLGGMKNQALKATALKLMSARAEAERRAALVEVAKPLLARWRAIHIALSVLMFVLLIAHVAISIWAMGL